jgi:hypothetical protein
MVQAYDPDSLAIGTDTSAEIDVRGYYEALLIVNVGDIASTGTLDCKVQAASTAAGSLSDITGAAITQQTEAGGDSNSVVVGRILCNGTNPFWKVITTAATAAAECGVSVLLIPYNTGDSDNTTMDFAV